MKNSVLQYAPPYVPIFIREYFVAEQVGIPAVYKELWNLSDGPTSDDHALHEFVTLRAANDDERKSLPLFGELANLLKTFQAVPSGIIHYPRITKLPSGRKFFKNHATGALETGNNGEVQLRVVLGNR